MELKLNRQTVFVTDLDDTLCYEADFVYSGLKSAADIIPESLRSHSHFLMQEGFAFGMQPFDYLLSYYPELKPLKSAMLQSYREHLPELRFRNGAQQLLDQAKAKAAAVILITDGRSISQRNKLKALSIESVFDKIYISGETGHGKVEPDTYADLLRHFPDKKFVYVGDNPAKDFEQPLLHGWRCLGLLNDGRHIHSQTDALINKLASVTFVRSLTEIRIVE
jgi:putative hydrolase of the HAD superfamily